MVRQKCFAVSAVVLLAAHGVRGSLDDSGSASPTCEGSCVQTWEPCYNKDADLYSACCSADDHCLQRNSFYAHCRPISAGLPVHWARPRVITCASTSAPDSSAGSPASRPAESPAERPADSPAASSSSTTPAKPCGEIYQAGVSYNQTTNCGVRKCSSPTAGTRAESAQECLAACETNPECNCAVWSPPESCRMLWPFCDAAVLNFTANGTDMALQPCRESVAGKLKPVALNSTYGECEPFELYAGVYVTAYGCKQSYCNETGVSNATTLDECLEACLESGYGSCRSATFDPNAAVAMCHLYNTSIPRMGAHATEQVPIQGGLGVVSASYCKPPDALELYPATPTTVYGVNYTALCDGGQSLVAIPYMVPQCGNCQVFPTNRGELEIGSYEGFYYRSTKANCIEDCVNDDRCGCAYYRLDDFPPIDGEGYCALTTVPCDQPDIGATHDATLTHTAFHKCAYDPSEADEEQWTEGGGVDFYGVWDFVCESPDEFEYENMNTFCGPSCVLNGTYTTIEESNEACTQRCKGLMTCGCAYFETASGLCTLMWGADDFGGEFQVREDSDACISNQYDLPTGMHHEAMTSQQNSVNNICCHECEDGQYPDEYY